MLYKLYLIIKIKKIKIPLVKYKVYRLYKRGKIRNKISKILVKYKAEILALISWDIIGLFPISLRGNKYLLKLINNYS